MLAPVLPWLVCGAAVRAPCQVELVDRLLSILPSHLSRFFFCNRCAASQGAYGGGRRRDAAAGVLRGGPQGPTEWAQGCRGSAAGTRGTCGTARGGSGALHPWIRGQDRAGSEAIKPVRAARGGRSGAEAVDNAIKVARAATGRPNIIAFDVSEQRACCSRDVAVLAVHSTLDSATAAQRGAPLRAL